MALNCDYSKISFRPLCASNPTENGFFPLMLFFLLHNRLKIT